MVIKQKAEDTDLSYHMVYNIITSEMDKLFAKCVTQILTNAKK